MTSITVSTKSELYDALRKASGGETILIAPGDYSDIRLTHSSSLNLQYSSPVTVSAQDPSNPPRITRLTIEGAGNISFTDLLFDYDETQRAEWEQPFRVSGTDLSFVRCEFDGSVQTGTGTAADGYGTGVGLVIKGSNILIDNSIFFNWYKALSASGVDIEITNNEFHSIRSDGVNVSNSSGVTLDGNFFHDFRTAPGSGDHADMLQMWILDAQKAIDNVRITNNIFDIGEGNLTQSIFLGNEAAKKGIDVYYSNVLIQNNTVMNSHAHGITVGYSDGVIIRDNTVVQKVGADNIVAEESVYIPRIHVTDRSTNVEITGNVAHSIAASAAEDWIIERNSIIDTSSVQQVLDRILDATSSFHLQTFEFQNLEIESRDNDLSSGQSSGSEARTLLPDLIISDQHATTSIEELDSLGWFRSGYYSGLFSNNSLPWATKTFLHLDLVADRIEIKSDQVSMRAGGADHPLDGGGDRNPHGDSLDIAEFRLPLLNPWFGNFWSEYAYFQYDDHSFFEGYFG